MSSKWVLQLKGETRKATRRADNFVEQLRGPGGWRVVAPTLPSGGAERICISPDNILRTVRTEQHANNKIKDILRRLCSLHTLNPQRRDGVAAALCRPVAKLGVRLAMASVALTLREPVFDCPGVSTDHMVDGAGTHELENRGGQDNDGVRRGRSHCAPTDVGCPRAGEGRT